MTYKEYYLKQHPELATSIDTIILNHCPAFAIDCKYGIYNLDSCLYQNSSEDNCKEICTKCWEQQMKEEKEKKKMTFKELWIALHPGKEFIHDSECTGKCPDTFDYEKANCPVINKEALDCKECWNREAPEETIKKFLGEKTEQTKKSPKFNIGDKVLVANASPGCTGCQGEIGIVTTEEASNGLLGNEPFPTINIKLENSEGNYTGKVWCVNEDGCELISKAPAPEKTTDDFPYFNNWSGKIIKFESGKVFLVIPFDEQYMLLSPEGNIDCVFDLLSPFAFNEKITEIYELAPTHDTLLDALSFLEPSQLLWKASEKKKMTYEDIVAALGYEFELTNS